MAISFAIVLSACYTVYFYLFYRFSKECFGVDSGCGKMLGIIIILMHFLPFMNQMTGNGYMYAANSVVCTYYYTIPALLNAMIVLLFSQGNSFIQKDIRQIYKSPKLSDGIWILLLYLVINSNMFQSILLAAYTGGVLLIDFINELRCQKHLTWAFIIEYCKKGSLKLLIIMVWLLSLLMEASGGRAASVKDSGNFGGAILACMRVLGRKINALNHLFEASVIAIIGMALLLVMLKYRNMEDTERKYMKLLCEYVIGMLLTTIYLVLLCAKAGTGYLGRDDVFSGILFWIFMIIWISIIYIFRRIQAVIVFMPIVAYVTLFATVINIRSYREFNVSGYNASIVKEIGDDIVVQVSEAASQGKDTMVLYVPLYDSEGNWPISKASGERIARTLLAHGIIDKRIEITVIPTEKMNEKYHLR